MTLRIGTTGGKAFSLPPDLVTQTAAVLAKKGSGKSYTAAVMAEELLDAGQQVVIIDPTGAHWGLRSSADGKAAGFPIVVVGGDHADLPLEEGAGEILARAVVERRFSAILDVSLLRKGAATRFLGAFFEALYRLNRAPLHLICDEADVYAPQKPFHEEARTLGAIEDIVRRGRIRGIGCTLITQRPAVINKNVLTQAEMLVALRMIHPKDIAAVMEWVEVHADERTAAKMLESLPSLPIGTAWFWSPGWGDIFERVQVRARRTFDSGATPKHGEAVKAPKVLAAIDVEKLGAEITATIEKARAEDPRELKRQIAELRRGLALQTSKPVPKQEVKVERVDVKAIKRAAENSARRGVLAFVLVEVQDIATRLERVRAKAQKWLDETPLLPEPTALQTTPADSKTSPRQVASAPIGQAPAPRAARYERQVNGALSKAERLVLTALAQYQAGRTKNQVAILTGYAVNGGGFNNAVSSCRSQAFLVGEGNLLFITPTGTAALGPFEVLPTGSMLLQHWFNQLGKAERAVLQAITNEYPDAVSKERVASIAGYEPNGGGFNNAISRLRTLELISGRGDLHASEDLFG